MRQIPFSPGGKGGPKGPDEGDGEAELPHPYVPSASPSSGLPATFSPDGRRGFWQPLHSICEPPLCRDQAFSSSRLAAAWHFAALAFIGLPAT